MPCDAFAGLDQRRLTGDRDVLGDRADLHRQVEREELLRADADAAAVDRLVALERRLDGVVAGSTLAKTYSPRSLVTVERLMLVCSLVSVTSTPGMTPPASLTDPRRPPWNPCPNAEPASGDRLATLQA